MNNSLRLKNFAAFTDLVMKFLPGSNIVVGEVSAERGGRR
jgi:hypothetical protein